jgi:hypothetical protein
MVIFLDLDGVLRRDSAPLFQLERDLVSAFSYWVRELEEDGEVSIVISSTWRTAFSIEEVRSRFPAWLAEKIVGCTPSIQGEVEHSRHREILAWLKKHGAEAERWIAIDDTAELYPTGLKNLILCDPEVGFTQGKSQGPGGGRR